MSINHINLVVKDVDKAVNLLTDIFKFNLMVNRNSKMAVLKDNNNFVLVIWGQELNKEKDVPQYPKNFHIGFYQDNEIAVQNIFELLKNNEELKIDAAPKKIRNTFGFYCYFENLMIEISVNPFNYEQAAHEDL
ncbi:VOC family protein [Sphingobacterium sp. 2149]|uniref:VOC family protein n=1 Tax=Sphingobacterium sp. 2149 TaxID=2817763 RepID=UPI001AE84D6A|nr:VOC family protein [Sphingobacterium sp. 2149]MDR6736212.1 catechol-2,3-dioxygenase [Sphingobacterium sp. 2149]